MYAKITLLKFQLGYLIEFIRKHLGTEFCHHASRLTPGMIDPQWVVGFVAHFNTDIELFFVPKQCNINKRTMSPPFCFISSQVRLQFTKSLHDNTAWLSRTKTNNISDSPMLILWLPSFFIILFCYNLIYSSFANERQ